MESGDILLHPFCSLGARSRASDAALADRKVEGRSKLRQAQVYLAQQLDDE